MIKIFNQQRLFRLISEQVLDEQTNSYSNKAPVTASSASSSGGGKSRVGVRWRLLAEVEAPLDVEGDERPEEEEWRDPY